VTSAQIQQLGTSATTASAQLSTAGTGGGGGLGGIFKSIGGLFGFDTGGFTGHGKTDDLAGFVHKGEYVFDAHSVDSIGLETLQNLRASAKGGGGRRRRSNTTNHHDSGGVSADMSRGHSGSAGGGIPDGLKIINVLDKGIVGDYLATREGEKLLMNLIRKNKG
jgi:hypothetical protein